MSIWAGGPKERMVAVKHLDPVATIAIESSKHCITQILMVKQHYFCITNLGKILILNYSGELIRTMELSSLF